MIIEKQQIDRHILVGEDNDNFDMSLSADDMQWLMTLLSDTYKDPFSIIPQEWCSNAWDSHLEAGCPDKPIILEIKKNITGKWFLAVHDFGVGISTERIKVFGAFGKSTKRSDKDMIGALNII